MFRIKICGMSNVEDALAATRAGADAVGLNFFPGSKRFVALDTAREIARAIPAGVVKVGVFVNAGADHVRRVFESVGLDAVQLHGDEPPELVAELVGLPVVRAFRLDARGFAPVDQYLAVCSLNGTAPQMILVDAHVPGQYGGTGQSLNWQAVADEAARPDRPPLVLAGGLTAKNVAEAIGTVKPAAVDTAGGVETGPGKKAPEKFIAAKSSCSWPCTLKMP